MAIYDVDANPNTAVTAWLAQFKVAANGTITYVAGTDTFHVYWIHRSLNKIAYDLAISGDDEINLTKPPPSTSEALGTIITLKDHTTDYGVKYIADATVMSYHFGGSVEWDNGNEGYYGLQVVGKTLNGATPLKVIQNHVELTSHWGTGKNQTDSNTLLRICVQGRTAGADIDNKLIHVKASKWGDTYAIWGTTLGLGESVAAINTDADPQNDTLLATVQGYAISKSEGYNLLDIDGAGNKPFISQWSYAALNKKALYEYVKAILVDGSADTLYGVDGDLWTGRLYDCTISGGTGTWVQSETLTWTGGSGNLVAVDNTAGASTTRLVLHLNTGVAPTDTQVITGNGLATGTVSGTPVAVTTVPAFLGTFTGSAWIGAQGVGFVPGELGSSDSIKDLDGTLVSPPNNVPIQINATVGNTGDAPHIFLARKDGVNNAPDYTVYTAAAGNNLGNGTFVVNEAIAADEPQTGYIMVLNTGGGGTTYEALEYTSWSGSTFTLAGTLPKSYTASDPAFVALFYEQMSGAGTTKTASNSIIHSADVDVIGWIRHGDPAAPDTEVPISATIGASGLSQNYVLNDEF